ncbi:MAG: hypothetical protein WA734_01035 [Candidatus Acidiferrales bacterium]
MRTWQCTVLLAILTFVGVDAHRAPSDEPQFMTAAYAAAVDTDVRAFMSVVVHDVTQDGPIAWRKHFADTPTFFMAVDGHLVFPNSAAATAGIEGAAAAIKHIELRWGDDLRVDPLAENLAVVAASYHEVRVDVGGKRVDEEGFFTGTVEKRDGRWQFRNAHWSAAAPTAK